MENLTIAAPQSGRYAVMDIGTVTARLLVADVTADGAVTPVTKGYAICNLGKDVDATGVLREDAMQRVQDAVEGFLAQRRDAAAQVGLADADIPTLCVATSASRDAANADEFRQRMARLGVELTIIPGAEEARLSFTGASLAYPGQPVIVIDIGGGSTEIVAGMGGSKPAMARSFNVGCRRMTERFLQDEVPTADQMEAARDWAGEEFGPFLLGLRESGFDRALVVAVAGTATSVVSIHKQLAVYDSAQVNGFPVSRRVLTEVLERLAAMPLAERRQVVGLDPKRADVIVGGLLILDLILEMLDAPGYVASEADLLEGAALALAKGEFR